MFGPAWHDMLESYTTLAYLAAATERVRLGTLVTGVTYRNVAHLGKIVATLDVLSGGRAVCGLGLGLVPRRARRVRLGVPAASTRGTRCWRTRCRYCRCCGARARPRSTAESCRSRTRTCYPRPLQAHVPILVGGNGERRTLRLAAQYADACNIIGEVDVVHRKVAVLHAHCDDLGRDRDAVEVTQLSTTLVGRDASEVGALVEQLRPRRQGAERYAASVNAGTVADQIGRFRALADAGVQTAIVSFPDLADADPVDRFAPVVAAFR